MGLAKGPGCFLLTRESGGQLSAEIPGLCRNTRFRQNRGQSTISGSPLSVRVLRKTDSAGHVASQMTGSHPMKSLIRKIWLRLTGNSDKRNQETDRQVRDYLEKIKLDRRAPATQTVNWQSSWNSR